MKKLIFLVFAINTFHSLAQDSIVMYNVSSQDITVIPPVLYDTAVAFETTSSSQGTLGNHASLSLTPPSANLFTGSSFSDIAPATLFFDVTHYPVRTAMRLFSYNEDTLGGCCSGVLISRNLVLTAAHCIRNYFTGQWRGDSTLVAAAYDNGAVEPLLPASICSRYYVFKSYFDGNNASHDYALLELKEPVGTTAGWIGMAFSKDTSFYTGKVFHKLSYPGMVSPFDTTRIYNGDTLYYNYGYISNLSTQSIGVLSPQAQQIPGQSGSPLFYTDNTDYYTMGLSVFSSNYNNFKITNEVFYQFKNIMENYATGIADQSTEFSAMSIYPNPFQEEATIAFSNPDKIPHELILYTTGGQVLRTIKKITSEEIKLTRDDLSPGLYYIQIQSQSRSYKPEVIVIR